jgi:hypothetical protein
MNRGFAYVLTHGERACGRGSRLRRVFPLASNEFVCHGFAYVLSHDDPRRQARIFYC